ncbi:unnamed protein product, partial [Musa hybrid cultivar]
RGSPYPAAARPPTQPKAQSCPADSYIRCETVSPLPGAVAKLLPDRDDPSFFPTGTTRAASRPDRVTRAAEPTSRPEPPSSAAGRPRGAPPRRSPPSGPEPSRDGPEATAKK